MDQLSPFLGPLGLTAALLVGFGFLGRAVYTWVMGLWQEHLRVDHERQTALVAAHARNDQLRESNDANAKIMERAVAQNERLLAAVLQATGVSHDA